jgi:hypothetical protein
MVLAVEQPPVIRSWACLMPELPRSWGTER